MTNNSLKTTNGKAVMLYRANTVNGDLSATQYLPDTKFKVGIDNATPTIGSTNLTYPVPITNGTICDAGEDELTGSAGGDNTTDNTTTYKQGGGVADNTSQNLIANNTDASKVWTITPLTAAIVTTKPFAYWLYIKDAATLAKIVSLTTHFRTNGDGATLYYEQVNLVAVLSVGWNWITSNTGLVSAMVEGAGGPPSGTINEFVITIVTANATDTFTTGDVLYDLLRQWATTDIIKGLSAGYPTLDLINLEVTKKWYLSSIDAVGFLINSLGEFNEDTAPLMLGVDTFTAESKSLSDEFSYIIVDRVL